MENKQHMREKHAIIANIRELLVSENQMAYLDSLPEEDLHRHEQEIQNYIQKVEDEAKPLYKVCALTTKFVPNFILAKMGQDYLSPFIISQITIYMDPKAAAGIGKSFRPDYLGEVTIYTKPELSAVIGSHMGMPHIFNIYKEMLRKGFFLRAAEIADLQPDKDLIAVTQKADNPGHSAKVLRYMKNPAKIRLVKSSFSAAFRAEVEVELKKLEDAGE